MKGKWTIIINKQYVIDAIREILKWYVKSPARESAQYIHEECTEMKELFLKKEKDGQCYDKLFV